MQGSGNSSVWKSLAVAFGDGVAFGVGMKMTKGVGRNGTHEAGLDPFAERMEQVEKRLRSIEQAPSSAGTFDRKVVESISAAIEARLHEHTAQANRKLADLGSRLMVDLQALDQRDQALQARMDADLASLRTEIVSVNRQFAATVSEIVADQVALQAERLIAGVGEAVETRLRESAEETAREMDGRMASLREDVAAQHTEMMALLRQTVEEIAADETRATALRAEMDAKLGVAAGQSAEAAAMARSLQGEVESRGREVTEIRKKLGDTDSTVLDFILAMGAMCQQLAGRVGPEPGAMLMPMPPAPLSGPADAVSAEAPQAESSKPNEAAEPGGEPEAQSDAPEFGQLKRAGGLWRVPLVSSFLLTVGGVLMMHYL